MKAMYYRRAGGYEIVTGFAALAPDPEATKIKAAQFLEEGMTEAQIEAVLTEHTEYRLNYKDGRVVEDSVAEDGMKKLAMCASRQALTTDLEYIPDYTGTEYWIKTDGVWGNGKIEEPGIPLPEGSIPSDALTQNKEAYAEITEQNEKRRIASLTDAQREEEMAQRLKAAARKVIQDAEIADLMGEAYDKAGEYEKEKAVIESIYA
jgi:hypothetical protein